MSQNCIQGLTSLSKQLFGSLNDIKIMIWGSLFCLSMLLVFCFQYYKAPYDQKCAGSCFVNGKSLRCLHKVVQA